MSATQCNNTSPRSRWREAPLIQVRFGPQSITASSAGHLQPTAKAVGKPPLPVAPPPPVLTNEDVIAEIYASTQTDFNPVECDSLVLSCSHAFKEAVENDTDGVIWRRSHAARLRGHGRVFGIVAFSSPTTACT